MIKKLCIYLFLLAFLAQGLFSQSMRTFCNPLNLNYRLELDEPSRRAAADPTVVVFRGHYFLFASKSGGYWHSEDLSGWDLITTDDLPLEEWSPTALNLGDSLMLFLSSDLWNNGVIYGSEDPPEGEWQPVGRLPFKVFDAVLFLDDDRRLYVYNVSGRIRGVELDPENGFALKGDIVDCIRANYEEHGWEEKWSTGTMKRRTPSFEGAWINKYNGRYYLQYAAPGTQFPDYGDGVYVSDYPLGPYTYEPYSPFSFKPSGFCGGAGHGSTFRDHNGNLWHMSTMVISDKHKYERRIGLFPAGYDEDGQLYSNNTWGDYPQLFPKGRREPQLQTEAGWMLLSGFKSAKASSSLADHPEDLAFDENIKTYWVAESADHGEWLRVDLGDSYDVYALQVNFAEYDPGLFGRVEEDYHQYTVEYSLDGNNWRVLIDKSKNRTSVPHDYVQLDRPRKARYIKLTNVYVPGRNFAVRDLRVFGTGNGNPPGPVQFKEWDRKEANQRFFSVKWEKAEDATGYLIEFGISGDKLYNHYMIYRDTILEEGHLNKGADYYFTVRAFNENGISGRSKILALPTTGAYEGRRFPWE